MEALTETRIINVAIIEDRREIRDGLATLIDFTEGFNCTGKFGSMEEAITRIRHNVPDVVLSDIGLPGMDGHEVARRIRRRPEYRDVTLIAMTGWGQEQDRRRTRAAGFDHHLTKPADVDVLGSLLYSLGASKVDPLTAPV